MPWQGQFEDLRHTSGTAWYRHQFVVQADWLETAVSQAAILHFGAVNYQAMVWLNGALVSEHEGGYLPFEFCTSNLLHEGDNELLVRVVDVTDRGNHLCFAGTPDVITVTAQWLAADGTQLATNQVDLVCVAIPSTTVVLRIVDSLALAVLYAIWGMTCGRGVLIKRISPPKLSLPLSTCKLETNFQQGGRVLLLADPNAISEQPYGRIVK